MVATEAPRSSAAIVIEGRDRFAIGRAPDNDLVLDDLRISRHHARLERHADGSLWVVDLKSANGTFVNGRRVGSERLEAGDFIGLGGVTLELHEGALRQVSVRHTAWFGAVDLVVDAGQKRILDGVSFALEPSSVLAIVGPSGCGKTTLMNALTGFRPADAGHVVYDSRDVYATYDDVRRHMGLVPQADILHTELTVRQALGYAAELRFPLEVAADARRKRIDEVMAELNISDAADTRIDRLSGGQRKRVSVGCELLTEPTLLFLDEPTSGLDPGNEASLMETLRDLARAGRTIVVVTHSVQSLDLADRLLVLAPGGHLAFFGAPNDALPYFEPFGGGSSYASMFRVLEDHAADDWSGRFTATPAFEQLVREPLASADLAAIPVRPNIDPPPPPTPTRHQLGVLTRRYLAVIRADRGFALALALQAPLFGVMFALLFLGYQVMNTAQSLNASILIWLLVVGATWLGVSNAIREIVKELAIYHRERAIGLSPVAYIASKVGVLAAITFVQVLIMVPIAIVPQPLPITTSASFGVLLTAGHIPASLVNVHVAPLGIFGGPQEIELLLVVILTGLGAMALGLAISAVAGSVDRASSVLPIVLVAEILVSAPLFTKPGLPLEIAGYLLGGQWGMAAASSTTDLNTARTPFLVLFAALEQDQVDPANPINEAAFHDRYDRPSWHHQAGVWFQDLGALAGLTALALLAAWYAMRSMDPDLMEGRHRGRRRAPPASARATPVPAAA